MRISFLVPRCTPDNSHGRYVLELAKRFSAQHSVTVYSGSFWPAARSLVQCRHLPVPTRPAIARLAALWACAVIAIRRRPADIVHVQGADAPVGNVVTAHCCNPAMRVAEGPRVVLRRRVNYALGTAAERYCLSKASTRAVIAVSQKVKTEIQREYGTDPGKIIVIPHGVDGNAFNPHGPASLRSSIRSSLGLRTGDFAVLFVGGDYRLKGLPALLEAARRTGGPIRVLVVGGRADRATAHSLSQDGNSHTVSFLGRTADVASIYAAADCFVLPTRYDTFSLSTLEAMASGLPVIVSRAAGVSELLTHERDALLLQDPEDVAMLAQDISRIINDETLRTKLGEEARRTAEGHSWDEVARRTLTVYDSILGDG